MRSYLDMLQYILDNGDSHKDRTGVGTTSVFGYQFRHDLRSGFPLLTTKKVFMKGITQELIWFLNGRTDNQWLQEKGVKIWNEWATKEQCAKFGREEGDLGPIYGKQWTEFGGWGHNIEEVKPRIPSQRSLEAFNKNIDTDQADNGDFSVSDKIGNDEEGRPLVEVLFNNGYKYTCRLDQARLGNVKNKFKPNVYGIGFIGNANHNDVFHKELYKCWAHMLERCYNEKCKEYKYYGGAGVSVCKRWHCFEAFYNDVKLIPNWHSKMYNWSNYQLDKDHFSSNIYSPETTVWIPKHINFIYRNNLQAFIGISPDGQQHIHIDQSWFANAFNLNRSKISACLCGRRNSHKGWTFKWDESGKSYRYVMPVNQIKNLIDDIQNNPGSRRLIVTGWNPQEATKVALPPCHTLWQCKVIEKEDEKYLDLQLFQRSQDVFLGGPFNIASYALLNHLIAHVCGLKPRNLILSIGDLHIYNNHIDQVKLQLTREPLPLPSIKLNDRLKNGGFEALLDFKYEDLELIGYQSHDVIKAPVAI